MDGDSFTFKVTHTHNLYFLPTGLCLRKEPLRATRNIIVQVVFVLMLEIISGFRKVKKLNKTVMPQVQNNMFDKTHKHDNVT